MVAKIITGKSIRGMLHYNENKVLQNSAQLIVSSGFSTDVSTLNFQQKLQRFEHLTMMSGTVKTNAVHISLNFDGQDKLSNELLQQIAIAYMEKIGFDDQPYLVYKHTDAAHPHVHIATTNMKADGERINLHNIGRVFSEPARKALEMKYGLVKADGRRFSNTLGIRPAVIEKVIYGEMPTKRSIANIVNAVLHTYKFTSLAEMNAILKQFNIMADRGVENSMMFQKKGLMYSVINQKGEPVGVPIKASSLYEKPTLAKLESKFAHNQEKRIAFKAPLKDAIEETFHKYTAISKATFCAELANRQVNVLFRTNEQGLTFGVTFIDNRNKTVFNGSNLGKAYSAKALLARFSNTDIPKVKAKAISLLEKNRPSVNLLDKYDKGLPDLLYREPDKLLQSLLDKPDRADYESLLPKKKSKKRKGLSL